MTESPIVPDADIWQPANLLIREHGDDAEATAARRAAEMLDRDESGGHRVWLRIKRAVVKLRGKPTRPVH
jgi:hypothetical protein